MPKHTATDTHKGVCVPTDKDIIRCMRLIVCAMVIQRTMGSEEDR